MQVHNPDLFLRIARDGTLGLGEAYMDGWWDCEALDEMITRGFRAGLEDKVRNNLRFLIYIVGFRLFNRQSRARAFEVGERHYDIGNDVFEQMLDPHMNYSCGFWASARNLEEAQIAKMEMICAKLQIEAGMKVLDIGCGWGGLVRWMARHHGVHVTGVTVSGEQAKLARDRCADLPVDIEVRDYRELEGQFDRIVSVGMFEHVGQKNYQTFFSKARSLLKDQGLFLLHTIGAGRDGFATDRWIEKYIFPNSVLPPAPALARQAGTFFTIEDWHNFGADYDPTLMAWYRNLNDAWPMLKAHYGRGASSGCSTTTFWSLQVPPARVKTICGSLCSLPVVWMGATGLPAGHPLTDCKPGRATSRRHPRRHLHHRKIPAESGRRPRRCGC